MTKQDEDQAVEAPAFWVDLQRELGRLFCTPLDASRGHFRAPVEHYSPALLAEVRDEAPSAHARLALYHEQVWKRFFNALQESFPRLACVMGYFRFNGLASAFLEAYPPRCFDLGEASAPFYGAVSAALAELLPAGEARGGYQLVETSARTLGEALASRSALAAALAQVDAPWSLLSQALHFDEAERRAFRAPWEAPFCPSAEERARLASMRLRYAPSFSLLRVDYDLPLRHEELTTRAVERLRAPLHCVIVRAPRGLLVRAVDPMFARLLARGRLGTFGAAVRETEGALAPSLRDRFLRSLEEYVSTALDAGFWVGASLR